MESREGKSLSELEEEIFQKFGAFMTG